METPGRNRVRFLDGDADTTSTLEMGAQRDVDGGEWGGSVVPNQSFDLQEDPSFWKDNSVQVVIRVRPLSSNEISLHGPKKCVRQDSSQTITWTGHPECRFTFDHVADGYVTQERLFKVAGVPMIDNCVAGYNSCMFAYGQTGSGKTYTMLGDIEGGTRRHSVDAGITPRVFEYLFSRIQREKESQREEKLRFTCKCSFLEIYNEHILDLLEPSSANLQIREDMRKGVYVENLKEVEVSSARDVIQQLVQGSTNRKVASTSMNHASSRSHSVFTCIIESKWESQGVIHHRFARLNLVDLAGSERQKTSGAEGERLKEATNINKSLSTLGLVIMNLVSNSKQKSLHVPYRDSKLTFLLQDSLGGNSKTLIIANISPSNWCALETLSTLKFAQRAKFIRNNAIVNEDASGDVIAMRLEIQQLKREVSRLQGLVCVGAKEDVGGISACFTGSPGSFKWDGLHSSFSPLTLDKRLSLGKESEAALVASLKREQEKDKMIKALAVGRQAAEQLATQKSEEVQGLKMRLRFREERIKNLESRTTGPFSDASLQLEKDNLRKEIEILRNQIDRNPEITRFAMETLNVKEELRRMQSLVAEGQEERINEMSGEITILRDKLLEALEWKMMHEKDVNGVQELSASWDASAEEIELLKLQAIQYERNWAACLEEKQKLERHVQELVSQLEKVKTMKAVNEDKEAVVASHGITPVANDSLDDQVGLRTMVEAISAASQREAEAHETAIILARENEDLHTKLKDLIKEKEKMIEFYENVIAEGSNNKSSNDIPVNNECNDASKETKHLYDQLHEMQEENEKLMGLYEQAMQERDEFKRLLYSTTQEKTQAAANVADSSWSLRKAVLELDKLTTRIETVDHDIQVKQQDMASLKHYSNEGRYRKSVTENKLLALGHILQNFSNSKVQYWAEREEQAKSRTNACLRYIEKKKEELAEVQSSKFKCDAAYSKSVRLEAQLREKLNSVKQEIQNLENKKKESEKVLFSIENIEKTDLSSQRMNFGKASELLKSEEERTKLLVEMKQLRENLASLQREMVTQKRTSETWDAKIENLEEKLRSGAAALKEEESRLCKANEEEKEMVSQMEDVNGELEMLLVDYQEVIFQSLLKEAEGKLLVEEVEQQMEELEWLKSAQRLASEKMKTVLMEERVPSPQPELLRACFLDDCPTL